MTFKSEHNGCQIRRWLLDYGRYSMKSEENPTELSFSEQCALCVERLMNDRPWIGYAKHNHVVTAMNLLSAAAVFAAAHEANEKTP